MAAFFSLESFCTSHFNFYLNEVSQFFFGVVNKWENNGLFSLVTIVILFFWFFCASFFLFTFQFLRTNSKHIKFISHLLY